MGEVKEPSPPGTCNLMVVSPSLSENSSSSVGVLKSSPMHSTLAALLVNMKQRMNRRTMVEKVMPGEKVFGGRGRLCVRGGRGKEGPVARADKEVLLPIEALTGKGQPLSVENTFIDSKEVKRNFPFTHYNLTFIKLLNVTLCATAVSFLF